MSVDPVDGGGLNDYEYVGANPINVTDLDGQSWKSFWNKARKVMRKASTVTSVLSKGIGLIPFCGVCSAASLAQGGTSAVLGKAGSGSWKDFGKSTLGTGVGVAMGGFGSFSKGFKAVGRVYNSRLRYQGLVGAAQRASGRAHPHHSRRVMRGWALGMHFSTNGVSLAMDRLSVRSG